MKINDKTYKWSGNLSKRKKTKRIILHHAEATHCTADQIHSWHLDRGWCGIGYHFFVTKDGVIYRGRPEDTIGSHAKGYNADSIGICAEGRYQKEIMPETQLKALGELVAYLKDKYNINIVHKHKDVVATDCPGKNFPFEEIVNYKPTEKDNDDDEIEEDGVWGPATTRKAQEVFGTTVDGVVSNQYGCYEEDNPGLLNSTFEWEDIPGTKGSQLIKAIQRKVGVDDDGFIGPKTIKAMQKWLGTTQDGVVSNPSAMVKEFQRWLNKEL